MNTQSTSTPILELKNLNVHYGAIHALHGLNLKAYKGEIVTLLGSNGAGKSTTLRTISGLLHPSKGEVLFHGNPIHHLSAHEVVKLGISQAPEGRLIFPDLTVFENLEMGAFLSPDKALFKKNYEYMISLFPRLKERSKQLAGTLSGGEQQMVAMARAYMANPELLLLDEPSMGIAPILVKAIFDAIVQINKQGTTILLVEQNAFQSLKIAHRAYVLATGDIVMEGDAEKLLNNPEIQKAYLGH